jgi:hypothetical protein
VDIKFSTQAFLKRQYWLAADSCHLEFSPVLTGKIPVVISVSNCAELIFKVNK